MSQLNHQGLRDALREAVAEGWAAFKRDHPNHRVYGVGLYTAALAEYVGMTVFSEEGLDEVTAAYASETRPGSQVMKHQLRWSPCDSPHHMWREEAFQQAQLVLDAAGDPYDDDTDANDRVGGAFRVFVDVLRSLDSEGAFGSDRQNVVLSIWIGDQADAERIDYAKHLNPPNVAERFATELTRA